MLLVYIDIYAQNNPELPIDNYHKLNEKNKHQAKTDSQTERLYFHLFISFNALSQQQARECTKCFGFFDAYEEYHSRVCVCVLLANCHFYSLHIWFYNETVYDWLMIELLNWCRLKNAHVWAVGGACMVASVASMATESTACICILPWCVH